MSTIKEVAGLAGVSIGTVSHVIGGSVPVSDHLRRKVVEAIRTLDYHPNHIARSLKTRKTRTLGIVVPDMTIPFFPQVIRSAELAAHAHGYSIIAVNSDDSTARQKEVLSLLRSQRVDGILLVIASGQGSQAQVPRLIDSGIPVVCLDRLPDRIQVDSVCVEDCAAADMGVSHLLSLGHTRIAVLTGPLTLKNERERLRGYKAALKRAGIAPVTSLVWETKLQQEDVIRTCKQKFLGSTKRPSALFSTNGVAGLGALRGMAACKLSTPEDIAFVTFDELTAEDVFRPAITSVVQPAYEIGYRAAEILMERIKSSAPAGPRIAVRLPATLKIRESSTAHRITTSHAWTSVKSKRGGSAEPKR
jgi:DNA-binding LacI/PurR family transcriptional regulator